VYLGLTRCGSGARHQPIPVIGLADATSLPLYLIIKVKGFLPDFGDSTFR
jgi:hypothetical protein